MRNLFCDRDMNSQRINVQRKMHWKHVKVETGKGNLCSWEYFLIHQLQFSRAREIRWNCLFIAFHFSLLVQRIQQRSLFLLMQEQILADHLPGLCYRIQEVGPHSRVRGSREGAGPLSCIGGSWTPCNSLVVRKVRPYNFMGYLSGLSSW